MVTRVLIVEDDAVLADGMSHILRSSGHSVHCLADGIHAHDALISERYDLAILDLGIPRMDGIELIKRIRARARQIPILIVTARNAVLAKVDGLKAGADDYLTKPFDLAEFEARVEALTRRSGSASSQIKSLDTLEIDVIGRLANINGKPLELTSREFSMLEILMEHSGKAVTRDQLNTHMALGDSGLADNFFQVLVSRLRKKLEGSGVRISTVRGFGYLLQRSGPAKFPN